MKDSANYPITFGRHVATEHLKIMDSDARPIKLKPSCACTHVHVYIYIYVSMQICDLRTLWRLTFLI